MKYSQQNMFIFLLLGTLSCGVESSISQNEGKEGAIFGTYEGGSTADAYDSANKNGFEMTPYYEQAPRMTDGKRETKIPFLSSISRDFAAGSPNRFLRNRRKHARPLFYLNCSHRSQCYCYSKTSRHHYCCSCEAGACFPGEALVTTPQGATIPMNKLRTGDQILVASEEGKIISSEVLGFLDRRPFEVVDYITITTTSGQNLSLSGNHILLMSNSTASEAVMDFAQNLAVGDSVYLMAGNAFQQAQVAEITYELQKGAFVPLTKEGTLVVNGFIASCYASFPHSLAHSFLAPARNFPYLLRFGLSEKPHQVLEDCDPAEEEGYGEPAYVTLVKGIGVTFYGSERAPSDVLQLRATPKSQSIWNILPVFPKTVWMNSLTKFLGLSSLKI